jgi:hypothetical protein
MNAKLDQRSLHAVAIEHLAALNDLVDALKRLGPHPLDGANALLNIAERALALSQRATPPNHD